MSALAIGLTTQAALLGLSFNGPVPFRALGPLVADCVVEETHDDELEVSDHPVEQGAQISDHAVKLPAEVMLEYAWTASSYKAGGPFTLGGGFTYLNQIYGQLIQLQNARTLMTIYTGRRTYVNMLVQRVRMVENAKSANALFVKAFCREVILVNTTTVQSPTSSNPANMNNPQDNAPTQPQGTVQLQPAPTANLPAITQIVSA